MATILQMANRLRRFQENTDKIAADSIENTKDAFLDYNTEQLHHGLGKDGDTLRPYRSPFYAVIKNRMNPLPGIGNPDLRVTGAFYKGFYLRIAGDKLEIGSTDSKAPDLEKRYGADKIYGHSEKYKGEYLRENLSKEFMKVVHKETGL